MPYKALLSVSVIALTTLSAPFAVAPALAQQQEVATGRVRGTVTASPDGAPLQGAIVRLTPSDREVTAGESGEFEFRRLPPGDYEATVTYFGAEPFGQNFTVAAGQAATLNIFPTVEEIVVYGTRAAQDAARARERASDRFTSVIASDAMGQFGDQNVAESLQRLPAVNIFRSEGEGRFASIRGLPPSFGQVTFDGAQLASGGTDQRAFALDAIPSDLISAIEVTKTLTPDLDANSISGRINVESLSAFARGKNSAQIRAEGNYQEYSDKVSPKVSANLTRLFDVGGRENAFGVALSASYFNRHIETNDLRNDASPNDFIDDSDILILDEIDQRREIGVRERWGVASNFEYAPTDQDEFGLSVKFTRLTDDDTSIRSIFDLDNATEDEILFADVNSVVLSDVDLERQVLFQKSESDTLALKFDGLHTRGNWDFSYALSFSEGSWDKPDLKRARFQEENEVVVAAFNDRVADVFPISNADAASYGVDPDDIDDGDSSGDFTDIGNFRLDDVFLESSFRTDTVWVGNVDVQRNFLINNMDAFLKFGGKATLRDRDRDKDRITWQPTNGDQRDRVCAAFTIDDCNSALQFTQDDFTQVSVDGPPGRFGSFADLDEQRDVLEFLAPFADTARGGERILESVRDDYTLEESVYAGYAMSQIDVRPNVRLIGGFRVEHTVLETTGFISLENDDFVLPGDETTNDIIDTLGTARKEYTDIFPSLHVRYEPVERVVTRASYTTGTSRADFDASRNRILIDNDISLQDANGNEYDETDDLLEALEDGPLPLPISLASEVELELGNPSLDPAYAHNFDASAAWYPTDQTYISVAGFYKRIKDFIFESNISNVTLQDSGVGLVLPTQDLRILVLDAATAGEDIFFQIGDNQIFDQIEVTLNGDLGQVWGYEVAFSHSLDAMFDNVLGGIFFSGNVTYTDSKGEFGEVTDVELPLPGISKWTGNLSVGYEDDRFTLRTSGNYRSERIGTVDGDNVGTGLQDDYVSLDVNARFNVTDNLQVYFDGINLNEGRDVQVYEGNQTTGRLLGRIEEYGRSYQAGLRLNF